MARTHDLTRNIATRKPKGAGTENLHDRYGGYHTWGSEEGKIRHQRAPYSVPPYELTHLILGGTEDSEPAAASLASGRLLLLFTRGENVMESYSDDNGETWLVPPNLFMGGAMHPRIAVSRDGMILRAVYFDGLIRATLQDAGAPAQGTPFIFQNDAGGNLNVEDDTFGLSFAGDAPGRLLLLVRQGGSEESTDYFSTDYGRTWKLIP